jgi:acetyl-CoA carboxylase carboxyl transferase subunit beta
MVYTKDLEANWNVFPVSGYHDRLTTKRRIALLIDDGSWKETDSKLVSKDPLKFTAGGSYPERLAQHQKKSGLRDSVVCGHGLMDGLPVSLAIMDFSFMGASMGSVAGEKVTRAIERAIKHPLPDADGQDQRRPREAPRGRPALHRRPHQSHDGRRHGQLRDPR